MKDWLWRLSRAVAGEPAASKEVIRALKTARDKSSEVWLSPLEGENGPASEATARITTLERLGFRVRQIRPVDVDNPLALKTQLRLSIKTPYGRLVGRCRVLQRETVTGPSGLPSLEYVLSAPESLDSYDRKANSRGMLGGPVVIEGELLRTQDDIAEPVRGLIGALHANGAVLRSRNAAGRVAVGQRLYFKGYLPEPVGEFGEMATVERIERSGSSQVIYVKFEHAIDVIDEAMHDSTDFRDVA